MDTETMEQVEVPADMTVPVQQEYYGTEELYEFVFPDGVTKIVCKVMTEGDRQKYQSITNKDVRINRQSGDMHMTLSTGEERMALLAAAAQSWNLIRNGKPVTFSKGTPGSAFETWVKQAPPSLIDRFEREVRRHEPWLLGEATVEDLQEQIEMLQEQLDAKLKEEAGNDS